MIVRETASTSTRHADDQGVDVARTRLLRGPARRGLLVAVAGLAALAMTLPAGTPARADTPPPGTATAKFVTGWFPYWYGDRQLDQVLGGTQVMDEIHPFWTYFKSSSQLLCVHDLSGGTACNSGLTSAQRSQLARMKAAGLKVMPSTTDGGAKLALSAVMRDPASRRALVARITSFVVSNGFDGFDLDYEGFAFRDGRSYYSLTRPAWIAFVRELAASLQQQGRKLSVTIPAGEPYDSAGNPKDSTGYTVYAWSEIIAAVDRLRIMTYDYSFDAAGPIGPADWVDRIADSAVRQVGETHRWKLWLGIAAYGRDWVTATTGSCPSSPKRTSSPQVFKDRYAALLAEGRITSAMRYDATAKEWTFAYRETGGAGCTRTRTVWFQDYYSHLNRAQIAAKHRIGGVALWAFGDEEPRTWSTLIAGAPAIAPVKPVLTVTAPRVVDYARRVAVRASATLPGGDPIPGTTLTLQWLPTGGSRWLPLTTAKTAPDGTALFQPRAARNGQYRVVLPAVIGRSLGVSRGTPVSVRTVVSAGLVLPGRTGTRAVTSGATRVGGVAVVSGRVMPGPVRQTVVLTRRTGAGTWVTVTRGASGSGGRYAFRLPTTAAGSTAYRVVTRSTGTMLGGASTVLTLRVR